MISSIVCSLRRLIVIAAHKAGLASSMRREQLLHETKFDPSQLGAAAFNRALEDKRRLKRRHAQV
jgi:hypothetical protein